MVKQQVYSILTDTDVNDEWKLEELHRWLYRSETHRNENQRAIAILENNIEAHPNSDELAKWKQMLSYNQHDFELHKAEVDLINEAIHDIRSKTIGEQLELFTAVSG